MDVCRVGVVDARERASERAAIASGCIYTYVPIAVTGCLFKVSPPAWVYFLLIWVSFFLSLFLSGMRRSFFFCFIGSMTGSVFCEGIFKKLYK